MCIGKAAWFPAVGLNSGETVHGCDSQLQAGRQESGHCTLEGSLLSSLPSARCCPCCTEAQLHIQQCSSEKAQSSDFPPASPASPGSGTPPRCGGGPEFVLTPACCC